MKLLELFNCYCHLYIDFKNIFYPLNTFGSFTCVRFRKVNLIINKKYVSFPEKGQGLIKKWGKVKSAYLGEKSSNGSWGTPKVFTCYVTFWCAARSPCRFFPPSKLTNHFFQLKKRAYYSYHLRCKDLIHFSTKVTNEQLSVLWLYNLHWLTLLHWNTHCATDLHSSGCFIY